MFLAAALFDESAVSLCRRSVSPRSCMRPGLSGAITWEAQGSATRIPPYSPSRRALNFHRNPVMEALHTRVARGSFRQVDRWVDLSASFSIDDLALIMGLVVPMVGGGELKTDGSRRTNRHILGNE